MKKLDKSKMNKIIRLSLLTAAGFLLVICLTLFIIIYNYINKINLVSPKEIETIETYTSGNLSEEDLSTGEETELYSETNPGTTQVEEDITQGESSILQDTASKEESSFSPDIAREEINALETRIRNNILNNTEVMEDKQVQNILLIGSDTRNSVDRGRSDSMILITINKDTKKIIATSFLRDIYLQISGKENNRLNAAYAFGGADLLMKTMKQNFKIQIDHYIIVDFLAFIDIVDAVDGITLDVKEEELDSINSYVRDFDIISGEKTKSESLFQAGTCNLNGKQALGYSRNRYTKNGDFDRTDRQRKVLTAIFDKVKKQNLLELNDLLNIILPKVTTNFTKGEIVAQLLFLPSYIGYDLEQWSIPMKGTYTNMKIRGMQVLGIDFDVNISEIQNRLYHIN